MPYLKNASFRPPLALSLRWCLATGVMKRMSTKGPLPLGPDHPIESKIRWAQELYDAYGNRLLSDSRLSALLRTYQRAIEETWQVMVETGVVAECTDCAVKDGGSCCGAGIEDKFDTVSLLVNLLMGSPLPRERMDPTGCFFLGERGCTIQARQVICINYICRRLEARIDPSGLQRLHRMIAQEADAAFVVEEYIKSWFARRR